MDRARAHRLSRLLAIRALRRAARAAEAQRELDAARAELEALAQLPQAMHAATAWLLDAGSHRRRLHMADLTRRIEALEPRPAKARAAARRAAALAAAAERLRDRAEEEAGQP